MSKMSAEELEQGAELILKYVNSLNTMYFPKTISFGKNIAAMMQERAKNIKAAPKEGGE